MSAKPARRQCSKCPWKVGTDPNDIPNGYDAEKHRALKSTVGHTLGTPLRIMACHETQVGKELPCVGWLENQLGPGNNIALRMQVVSGRIDANVETVGEQHACLEDTFPA